MNVVQVIGVEGIPKVKVRDDVAAFICEAADRQGTPLQSGDIIVVTHVIVSVAEGRIRNLDDITPSMFAENIAKRFGKDPAMIELVLRESKSIRRMDDGKLITESKQGFTCANSGIDKSNVPGARNVALLPEDPDISAATLRRRIREISTCDVAVIISDTHGRPLREGEINIAIGLSGIKPIRDRRGEKDLFGHVLKIKQTAIADELASAAELVIGQADEGIPVAIIRGYTYPRSEVAKATSLARKKKDDLFR